MRHMSPQVDTTGQSKGYCCHNIHSEEENNRTPQRIRNKTSMHHDIYCYVHKRKPGF